MSIHSFSDKTSSCAKDNSNEQRGKIACPHRLLSQAASVPVVGRIKEILVQSREPESEP